MRQRQLPGRVLTLLASLVGVAASVHLLGVHLAFTAGEAMGGLCGISDTINCDAAAGSRFATFLGIPIALLGMGFYVGAAILSAFNPGGEHPRRAVRPAGVLQTLFVLSTLYSVYLFAVSIAILGSFCPFCGLLYGVNIAGVVTTWMWLGAGPTRILPAQIREAASLVRTPALPTVVVLGVLTVGAGTLVLDGLREARIAEAEAMRATLAQDTPRADDTLLLAPHAGVKGPEDAPVTLVEFSNFGCPFCGRLAESIDAVADVVGDRLRVVYRHYPIRPDQRVAALAGICAVEQDLFWPLHDLFFEHLPVSDRDAVMRLAGQAGLDTAALAVCMDDPRATRALEADLDAGRALGVQGTPTFYVNGRQYVGAMPPAELRRIIEAAARDAAP